MRSVPHEFNVDGRYRLACGAGSLAFAVVGLALATAYPRLFRHWCREDAWVEWATFVASAAAGARAIANVPARHLPAVGRSVLLAVGLFCVFVAGEEISWGHRLFGYRPPDVFLENNFQQEANLHNLFKAYLDTRWMVAAVALGYGVTLPLVARAWRPLRSVAPDVTLVPTFVTVGALELCYPFKFTGELAEAILGLAFLGDVAMRTRVGDAPRGVIRPMVAPSGAVIAGVLLVPLVQFAHGTDPAGVAVSRARLESWARQVQAGAVRSKVFSKGRIHKRLFSAVRSGYLRFKRDRPDAPQVGRASQREFYLDPWNQPYWILVQRFGIEIRIVLYSFGPNRRRDSEFHHWPASRTAPLLAGDDVGVIVEGTLY